MLRTTKLLAVFAAATAMTAVPALAQDDANSGTGDRSTHFNGFYIGAGGGYNMQQSDNDSTVVFDTDRNGAYDNTVFTAAGTDAFSPRFCSGFATSSSPATGCRGDQDAGEFFGRIGYDRRMGNFVVGGVIEAGKSYAKDYTTAFSTTPAYYTFERGIDWSASARLRAGYTPNGGVLFYATGGGTYANMKRRFYTDNGANSFAANDKNGAWGYQVGGGVEAMVTRKISIGMEYLYTDINDDDSFIAVGPGTAGPTNAFRVTSAGTNMRPGDQSFNYHAVRGSVNFHF